MKKDNAIKLSDHFTYRRLFRFVIPSILMMIFTSIYGVVDGFFISNYAGKMPFAAVNLILPFIFILGAIGFMLGAGGSAIVAKTMGEGREEQAKKYFSMIVFTTIGAGILVCILGNIFLPQVCVALGANDNTLSYCIPYGRISLCSLPCFMLQNVFQTFLVTAEKPRLGLGITLAAGCSNMFLDFLLVGVLQLGVYGAAFATFTAETMGGLIPLIYFLLPNKSRLRIVRTSLDLRMLRKACINGSSELMTNISMSTMSMVYNIQLLRFANENGVAAYGVIMYAGFIFVSFFIGYSMGTAPLAGYNHGAGNHRELHNIYSKSLRLVAVFGVVMCLISFVFARPIASIFVGYDADLLDLTTLGFRIYNLSALVMGFNIYASSFFTALGNGLISALISFLRTLLFQLAAVILLPLLFGLDGIWFSVGIAELLALGVTIYFLKSRKKLYHY